MFTGIEVVLRLGHWSFVFVSDFGFAISDFYFGGTFFPAQRLPDLFGVLKARGFPLHGGGVRGRKVALPGDDQPIVRPGRKLHERGQQTAVGKVPELDAAVAAGRGQPLLVGAGRHRIDPVAVPAERVHKRQLLAVERVRLHRVVGRGDESPLAIPFAGIGIFEPDAVQGHAGIQVGLDVAAVVRRYLVVQAILNRSCVVAADDQPEAVRHPSPGRPML